jgi:hypothetical protein
VSVTSQSPAQRACVQHMQQGVECLPTKGPRRLPWWCVQFVRRLTSSQTASFFLAFRRRRAHALVGISLLDESACSPPAGCQHRTAPSKKVVGTAEQGIRGVREDLWRPSRHSIHTSQRAGRRPRPIPSHCTRTCAPMPYAHRSPHCTRTYAHARSRACALVHARVSVSLSRALGVRTFHERSACFPTLGLSVVTWQAIRCNKGTS